MGGLFGVVSKEDCAMDLFFGTDYHSHLGTKKGGLAVIMNNGIRRIIHNIENSPFRTKFEDDIIKIKGNSGIGCISDFESQPLSVHSHLGRYAISTVGRIDNIDELVELIFAKKDTHFIEMSSGEINPTELVAMLIDKCDSIEEGIVYAQSLIKGSMSILILTPERIIAARDKYGRTPLIIGKRDNAYCVSFESFAFLNLGYVSEKIMGPGEIVELKVDGYKVLKEAENENLKICAFLWVYFGYPCSSYEDISVEEVRYNGGAYLAKRDKEDGLKIDHVAAIPDSGIGCAIGYTNSSDIPYARPFIKYTPTWPRSFMPQDQRARNLIARMKLIPVGNLIKDKSLLFCEDSIVRGTQLSETVDFLYELGAKEIHVRPACPPLLFGCKYLNFARSRSELELITRKIIQNREKEVTPEILKEYADCKSQRYKEMVEEIRKQLNLTTLKFLELDDMVKSIGLPSDRVCTYCWSGRE